MFRAKKLDLGCFINVKVIRDHTKRKVFAEHEVERYEISKGIPDKKVIDSYMPEDKRFVMQSVI